jgi:uncharacterized protein YndB with AHSA1/START domain
MKWVLIPITVLVILFAAVFLIGAFLPKEHMASRTVRLNQPPEKIWQAMTDYTAQPSWREDLKRVEMLPNRDGHPVWKEIGKNGEITFEQIEAIPPSRLVIRIADPGLPFGGTWTVELIPTADGSRVSITENGELQIHHGPYRHDRSVPYGTRKAVWREY